VLDDGSTWCTPCHAAALADGDEDGGRRIRAERVVVLPAEIAEHLPALLFVARQQGWRSWGGKPWPQETSEALMRWLEAQP
jgi:hypothetical protein